MSTSPGTGPPKPPKKPAPNKTADLQAIADEYNWKLAVFKSNPELWALLNNALKGKWNAAKFVVELQKTNWYKKHSASWREDYVLHISDPGTWKTGEGGYDQTYAALQDEATQVGATVSPKLLDQMTRQAMAFKWSDSQIRNHLAMYVVQAKGGTYGGEAGAAETELRQYAADQGITLSDSNVKKWLQSIVRKSATLEQYKGWIKQQAMNSYTTLGDQIKAGQTVRQLADPYVQEMAQTLQLNPASINLKDPTIMKALQSVGPDGKPTQQPLWAFSEGLRRDPRWMQTDTARSTLLDTGNAILKDFGLM